MRLGVFISLALAVGCAGNSPVVTGGPETQAIAVGSDIRTRSAVEPVSNEVPFAGARVFQALTLVYDTLGMPLTTLDFKRHLIGNDGMKVRQKLGGVALSKYVDCGSSQLVPSADTYEVSLSVLSHVALDSTSANISTVTTTVSALARPVEHAQEWFQCKTKGTLEKKIIELIPALIK